MLWGLNKVIMSTKEFLYYYRISIKEVLDIETEKPHLEIYVIEQFQESAGTVVNFL